VGDLKTMSKNAANVKTNWEERYKKKKHTARQAINLIQPGCQIFIGTGAGEPQALLKELINRKNKVKDAELMHVLTLSVAPSSPEFSNAFRYNAFFIGESTRQAVIEGRADYTPIFLSEIPRALYERKIYVDVALIQVCPPDEHGFCSFGVSVDITKAATKVAKLVIAQVNANMPRTLGDSFIHIDELDVIVEINEPLIELQAIEADKIIRNIGKNVAKLVENGSTLQIGIGAIPDAVLASLITKKDLGVHTEMISDGLIELIEKGVVNNSKKTINLGKVIASFCIGTQKTYDFINNNPIFEFHPSEYTNDVHLISQNYKMVAINGALEIDLTGQVCADSIGYQFYSGIGGQMDFLRGAALAKDGKPIIALPSTVTLQDGTIVSRIVSTLTPGAGVVTTRGDVHYVVTEWGIADLHSKTIRERVMELISIAHPKFREQLLQDAKERKWVFPDQMLCGDAVYPEELEKEVQLDGLYILFRPIRFTDEREIRRLFYSFSEESRYYRFCGVPETFPHEKIQEYCTIDYDENLTIIAVLNPKRANEKIIGAGRYSLDRSSNQAELSFEVHEDYRNKGIATHLLRYLIQIGRQRGIKSFIAEVLPDNRAMLRVFHKVVPELRIRMVEDVYQIEFNLEE